MKLITLGLTLWVALLVVPRPADAQPANLLAPMIVVSDTIPGVPGMVYIGAPVRATFADCGNPRLPRNLMTGTLLEMEQEALQLKIRVGDQDQLQQISFNDLLRLEVGTEKALTRRGTLYGAIGGAVLGIVGTIAASGSDAEYASGAVIGGLLGGGVGGLIGGRTTTMEWRDVPLYGDPYCR